MGKIREGRNDEKGEGGEGRSEEGARTDGKGRKME